MKKFLLLLIAVLLFCHLLTAQGICNPAGNLIIYSNYDGGDITIDINENIPNIKIGLCSYEDLHVTITGSFASNVVQVLYAGYNSGGTTTVSGVDPGIIEILNYPPATLYDPDGNVNMVCAYECDTAFIPGGCNTVNQATDYFLTELGGGIRYGYFQYGAWIGTYNMGDGGNCCVDAACSIIIDAGQDKSICVGDSVQLNGEGGTNYSWSPPINLSDYLIGNPFASPILTTTYYLTGTNADGCTGFDTVIVTVFPLPEAIVYVSDDTLFASGGANYQWLLNGEIIPGAISDTYIIEVSGTYSVIVTSADGCEQISMEFLMAVNSINVANRIIIDLFPNPADDELIIDTGNLTGNKNITIFNSTGKIIKTLTTNVAAFYTINTAELTDGIYFLMITFDEGSLMKEVVIQH